MPLLEGEGATVGAAFVSFGGAVALLALAAASFLAGVEAAAAGFFAAKKEAELDAMLVEELIFEARANLHKVGHVALVECREHGSSLLCFDEACCDALAQWRHFFDVYVARARLY